MTPFQALQTSPKVANDLFAQIADTGPGAVKTRERLFAALKTELELLARLEEDHLLPVLKRRAETKALAPMVVEGLKRTRALLSELEAAPRDDEAFTKTAVELKRSFQQHLRDEKSDLLPAIKKALSDEEAQTLADKIEADKAEVEAAARHDAEERRAEARREREEAEEIRLAEEAAVEDAARVRRETARAVKAAAETARATAEEARATAETGLRVATDVAQQSVERFTGALRATGESTRSFAAVAQCGSVLAQGFQGASREWMSWAQTRAKTQAADFTALMQCRSAQDLIELQSRVLRDSVEQLLDAGGRVSEIARTTADDAAKAITRQG